MMSARRLIDSRESLSSPARDQERAPLAAVRRMLATFAAQDWVVALYLVALTVGVLLGSGPRRPVALGCVAVDQLVFWGCMLMSRGGVVRHRIVSGALYRFALVGIVLATFMQLHHIHAVARHVVFDAGIYALDVRLFGVEPAVAWQRFVTPATTEWFAFFYYSYFLIVLAFILPMTLMERRVRLLSELSFGLFFVVCVGHTLYLFVPGRGPYVHLAEQLSVPLEGQFWWPLVQRTVDAGDEVSRRDIFPSLHTAVPTFLTLFSLRHRKERPFRLVWPVLLFFTSQIIVATMFLRWHYLLDVVAGLALALTAFLLARAVAPAEARRRRALAVAPVWAPLVPRIPPIVSRSGRERDA